MTTWRSRQFSSGFSMIEVLVALLIISIGVLGYAGLQLRALVVTENAHYRTQAAAISQDIIERAAANPQQLQTYGSVGSWQVALSGALPNDWNSCVGASVNCSPAQMAASDIQQVRWMARQMLPEGQVQARACQNSLSLCVTVSWLNTPLDQCNPLSENCVQMEAVIWEAN